MLLAALDYVAICSTLLLRFSTIFCLAIFRCVFFCTSLLCALNRFASKLKHFKIYTHNCQKMFKFVYQRVLIAHPYQHPHPPLRCSFSLNLHFAFERQLPAFVCEAPLETHKWPHKKKNSGISAKRTGMCVFS